MNKVKKGQCGICGKKRWFPKPETYVCGSKDCISSFKNQVAEWSSVDDRKRQKRKERHTHDGQNKLGVTYLSCGCNTMNVYHGKNCPASGHRINK